MGDVNNDGRLDAYIGAFNDVVADTQNLPSSLLIGDGTGNFDLAVDSGAEFPEWPCVASFMDLDDDGDSDIIVATCNRLVNGPGGVVTPIFTPIYIFRNSFAQDGNVKFENDGRWLWHRRPHRPVDERRFRRLEWRRPVRHLHGPGRMRDLNRSWVLLWNLI